MSTVRLAESPGRAPGIRQGLAAAFCAIAVLIAGLLAGGALRLWAMDLNGQRTHLSACVAASRHAHPVSSARDIMTALESDVPQCMGAGGYRVNLAGPDCQTALWQGDVYCYEPANLVPRMLYRALRAIERRPALTGSADDAMMGRATARPPP